MYKDLPVTGNPERWEPVSFWTSKKIPIGLPGTMQETVPFVVVDAVVVDETVELLEDIKLVETPVVVELVIELTLEMVVRIVVPLWITVLLETAKEDDSGVDVETAVTVAVKLETRVAVWVTT